MKHRGLLKVVLLSYVTLGIYQLVWLWKVREGLLERLQDKKAIPSLAIALGVLLVLGAILFAALISALYAYDYDQPSTDNSLLWVILPIVVFVPAGAAYWLYRFTRALHMVVGGISPLPNLVLFCLLSWNGFSPLWMAIVQNDINKFLEKENPPPLPLATPTVGPPVPPQITPHQPGPPTSPS